MKPEVSDLKISVKVHSDLRYVDLFHALLNQVAKEVDMDQERCDWVALSLREAVNNAVLHGNKKDPSKCVTVEIEHVQNELQIRVWDEGTGFDEVKLQDPRKDENLFKPNGRGIFLIKQFVTSTRFLRGEGGGFGIEMRVALDEKSEQP